MLRGRRAAARDLLLAAAERTGLLNRYLPTRFAQLSNAYPSAEPGLRRLRAGMRLPDVPLESGWLRDTLRSGDPVLLVLAADARSPERLGSARRLLDGVAADARPGGAALRLFLVSRLPGADDLTVLADPDGRAHAAVGAREPSVVLLRPDGIVALACRFGDPRIAARIRELAPRRRSAPPAEPSR